MEKLEVTHTERDAEGRHVAILSKKVPPGGSEARIAALEADVAQLKAQIQKLLTPPAKGG